MRLPCGTLSLYLDIYKDGKRSYEFLGIKLTGSRKSAKQDKEKKLLAESIRIKRENEILIQEKETATKENLKLDFLTFFESFVGDIVKSHKTYLFTLIKLQNYAGNKKLTFRDITKPFLIEFQNFLMTTVSSNTASIYMQRLKHALNYAVKQNILPQNPYDLLDDSERLHYENKERCFMTISDLKLLVEAKTKNIDEEIKQLFLFSCFTGLRWGDAYLLMFDQILQTKNDRYAILLTQRKTKKPLSVPMPEQAIKIYKMKLQEKCNEYLFPTTQQRLERNPENGLRDVNSTLKRWAKQAGLNKNLHFHVARHTNVTLHLCNGTDLVTISSLLGHSNVKTTTIYTHVVNNALISAVGNLPQFR